MSRNKREGKYAGYYKGHQREVAEYFSAYYLQPCSGDARWRYHQKFYKAMKAFMKPV